MPNPTTAHRPKLLIIEDHYVTADSAARYFARQGAEVIGFAPSLEKAREIIGRGEAFDVAVVDVKLRDAEVYEVADLVREKGCRLVFYTALEAAALPERFKDAPLVQKPAHFSELYRVVLTTLK